MARIHDILRRDEGLKLSAYQDTLGYWTIGYGHLIDARRNGRISAAAADFILDEDIRNVDKALDTFLPFWKTLDDARRDVLRSMAFQMGVGGLLGFRNTLAALEAGHFDVAATGIRTSKWYTQTPKRAERLAKVLETGDPANFEL